MSKVSLNFVPHVKAADRAMVATLSIEELKQRKTEAIENGKYALASLISRVLVMKASKRQ